MSVLYVLKKDQRAYLRKPDPKKEGDQGIINPNYKKLYPHVVHTDVMDIDKLAEQVEQNCSMKKSDCKAVIEELISVVRDSLLNSKIVKLNGFGQFKIGLTGKPADSREKFDVAKNIVGHRINFLPAYTVDRTTKQRTVALTRGIRVKETAKNAMI